MSLKLPRNWDFSSFRAETGKIARSKSVMPGEGSLGPCRPSSPKATERPLKTGWLKKQRAIVKNWQLRYFVLKGQTLYYNKDDKEGVFQGCIPLKSSQVNEMPLNADDPGKFLFEIILGSNGDRERDSYVLMANSQNEMEEWVRAIRRVIGAPSSGAVFGRSLSDTIANEQKFGPHLVPILVQKCAEFIRQHGLSEEGIFRLPGQDNQVKQFRDAFDAGERPSFPSDTDVHTVASLFKLYLRELPEPVVPWEQYQDFLDCSHQLDGNGVAGHGELEEQISLLPRTNYNLLSYICRFLYEVQQNSSVNKMSVENLATVIGVNLLKPQLEDPVTMMKGTPQIQKLMTVMIRRHEQLFPPSKDVAPIPPSKKSESKACNAFVGWEAAEDPAHITSRTHESLSKSTEEDWGSPKRGNLGGTESATQFPCESPSETDPWTGSPRKRTQTLPSLTCPFPRRGALEESLTKTLGGFQRGPLSSSPPPVLESDDQKGTFSEDIFKILDLQSSSFFAGTREANGDSARNAPPKPAHSIPLPHSQSSCAGTAAGGRDREISAGPVSAPTPSPELQAGRYSPTQKPSTEEYMDSLQRNKELRATVSELQLALDTERRRVATLEIRLRNAERSRDEAQRRNQELDREIQEFLARPPAGPP